MQPAKILEQDQTNISDKRSSTRHPLFNFFFQVFIVAAIFFVLGFTLGQRNSGFGFKGFTPKITIQNATSPPDAVQNVDFSLFWKVLDTLPSKYLDKSAINGQKILYGAISGMVRSLGDPYTSFLDPKQNDAVKSELSGEYEGIGIQIGFNREKRLVVIAPISGTPAEKEGLRPKDLILRIDKKDTFEMTLPEAVDIIRGKAGTKVKLMLSREGKEKPFEKEIERAKISVKSVEKNYLDDNGGQVAYLKVTRFGENTDSEWDAAVSEVNSKNVKAVIVDMRNNPGGLLTSAIHLGSEFVSGTIVKQEFSNGDIKPLPGDHRGKMLQIPMVVLINGGSASASEIFAGAIKDYGRGKVVGEQSFGKGTVQDVVDFPGGSSLHVTVAKWLTPDGHSIHDVGIAPDVKIEEPASPSNETVIPSLSDDPYIKKALEIL